MSIDRISSSPGLQRGPASPSPSSPRAQASADPVDQVQVGGEAAPAKKKWTVLVYANGKAKGMDRMAPSALRELEVAGSDENMNLVAQIGRSKRWYDRFTKDWSGVRRYEVERNPDPPGMQQELLRWFIPPYTADIVSPVKEELSPKTDMGSSATLSDFLQWGIKNYPAEHYAVLVVGQGGGFVGAVQDQETGTVLTNKGIEQALREASAEAGKKIDLVAFDGNFMGQLEVAHQLKDVADFMVASEAGVQLGSLSLDMVMKDLKFELDEKGQVSPEAFARWFVFETAATPRAMAELVNPTLSAVDLSKVDRVKDAYGALARALSADLQGEPSREATLREVIGETQNFAARKDSSSFYEDFRDLSHFARQLSEDERFSAQVQTAAQAVIAASSDAVIENARLGAAVREASGLSTYLPTDFGFDTPTTFKRPRGFDPTHGWKDTTVAQETDWGGILQDIAQDTAFHEKLRKAGLSEDQISKVDKALEAGGKVTRFTLGVANNAGHYEAYQAARGNPPKNFMGIPARIATQMAVAGGAYQAFRGAAAIFEAANNEELQNKQKAIVHGALDTATGVAVSAAAVGMLAAQAAGIAQPAGIVAFALPIAKSIYDVWETRRSQGKALEEIRELTPDQRKALGQAQTEDRSEYFVSPLVKGLARLNSSGPIQLESTEKS